MSTYETDPSTDEALREQYLKDLRESRKDIDYVPGGVRSYGGTEADDSGETATPTNDADPDAPARQDGTIDPDREQLGDGSWPDDEEREVGKPRLNEARRVLAETSARLGVDAVSAATLLERSDSSTPNQANEDIAKLRAQARQLAIETGVTHRITRDAFGRPVIKMVEPRVAPIGKSKRPTK